MKTSTRNFQFLRNLKLEFCNVINILTLLFGVLFTTLCLGATSIHAANVYIRAGATGANNGSDWNNAYTSLPATLIRGNTYYLADGSYGSYNFDDSQSGSNYIYIKKAIVSDHGTDLGWQDSYGDGDATFSSWTFDTGYYDIDGQVGKWASDLPGYQAYGIKVVNSSGKLLKFPSPGGGSYITIRHVEAYFTNTNAWSKSQDVIYAYGSNLTFEYCWFHDGGRVIGLFIGAPNQTFDHCVLEYNGRAQEAMGWDPSEHSEIIMFQPGSNNCTVRYSYIRDWNSTGGLILYDGNTDMKFYGNVFMQTGGYTDSNGNGAINGRSAGIGMSAIAYNNTFVDLEYGCTVFTMGSFSSRITKNNIFYNCKVSQTLDAGIGGTHDYNWFYNSGTQSETNIQNGSGDPFVNITGKNYHLSSATNSAYTTIGATYNTDLDGNTRGADGVWDRGAFEFQSGNPPPPQVPVPYAPGNLQVQ